MCCMCDGSCNHIGPHSFCGAHGGTPVWTFTATTTTTPIFVSKSKTSSFGWLEENGRRRDFIKDEETGQITEVFSEPRV